jgi:hypothetical protein
LDKKPQGLFFLPSNVSSGTDCENSFRTEPQQIGPDHTQRRSRVGKLHLVTVADTKIMEDSSEGPSRPRSLIPDYLTLFETMSPSYSGAALTRAQCCRVLPLTSCIQMFWVIVFFIVELTGGAGGTSGVAGTRTVIFLGTNKKVIIVHPQTRYWKGPLFKFFSPRKDSNPRNRTYFCTSCGGGRKNQHKFRKFRLRP